MPRGHCGSQVLHLGRTTAFLLWQFAAPSDTVRSGFQGGGFQVLSSWISPVVCLKCTVSSATGSSLHLLEVSQGQLTLVCIVLGVSWTLLTNNSKTEFLTPSTGVFVEQSMILGGGARSRCLNFLVNY